MQAITEYIKVGHTYVYFDGFILPIEAVNFKLNGLMSKHDFREVPQIIALTDPSIIEHVLSNPDYWQRNEIEQIEEDEQVYQPENTSSKVLH